MEITEFLTYDNIGLMTQIIISGLVVMATTQAFKSVVDRLIKFISRGKIKKIKTRDLTLIISILQPFSLYSIAFFTFVPYVPLEYA